jgi:SAM-dependent methyltransferase
MAEPSQSPRGFETAWPSAARLYDYFLGGHYNFATDREMAKQMLAAEPNARYVVTQNRAFLGRAVRYLLSAGVRQFLDLGSGIPIRDNVHEIVQRAHASARVVYVDNAPAAVAHYRQILGGNALATAICADLRDSDAVLRDRQVRGLIDFAEPVGLLLANVLHFVVDADDPDAIISSYARRLAGGSHLVISHATNDSSPGAAGRVQYLYNSTAVAAILRTRAEILRLFTGFDLVDPGLVYVPSWRPDGDPQEQPERAWIYAGVGRKPDAGVAGPPAAS